MHLSAEAMNGYARRALAPDELLAADDHLETCAACRERICDETGLRAAIGSLQRALRPSDDPEVGHLSFEQLRTHGEGILGRAEREILQAHLERCDHCAAEARDFAAFARSARALIESAPVGGPNVPAVRPGKRPALPEHLSAPESAAPRELQAVPQAPSAPSSAVEAGPAPVATRTSPGPVLLAILAGGLVAAVAAAWLVPARLRSQVGDLTGQVAELRRANEALSIRAEQAESLRADLERMSAEASGPLAEGPETAAPEGGIQGTALTLKDRRGLVGLDANGDLIGLDALPVALGRTIAAALRSGRVEPPVEVQELAKASGTLEEDASEATARPVAPVATLVKDSRPVFRWIQKPGAASYTVAVYDAGFNDVARSESITRTSWRPSRSLKRGELYLWQVIFRRGGEEAPPLAPPAPVARFMVLDAAASGSLERALRDGGGSHLAAGVLLTGAGCVDEAREEFRALLELNPDSPIARGLAKSLDAGREAAGGAGPVR